MESGWNAKKFLLHRLETRRALPRTWIGNVIGFEPPPLFVPPKRPGSGVRGEDAAPSPVSTTSPR